jgi:hypothetical protein
LSVLPYRPSHCRPTCAVAVRRGRRIGLQQLQPPGGRY